jgi:hypothetical protein
MAEMEKAGRPHSVLTPGNNDEDDDDDEDMANLFSFGSTDEGATAVVQGSAGAASATGIHLTDSMKTSLRNDETGSPDSFLDMLESETQLNNNNNNSTGLLSFDELRLAASLSEHELDADTRDILNWLDEDDHPNLNHNEDVIIFVSNEETDPSAATTTTKTTSTTHPVAPTVVHLPPTFETFQEALFSKESTAQQIRALYVQEGGKDGQLQTLTQEQRMELYCRMICHKSYQETVTSSLADSFEQWRSTWTGKDQVSLLSLQEKEYMQWIRQCSLSQKIANETNRPIEECEKDLLDIILYHQHQRKMTTSTTPNTSSSSSSGNEEAMNEHENNDDNELDEPDALIPTVATTILSCGVSATGAAVLLAQVIPHCMPLLALPVDERWEASLLLHTELYLLACYHVPLLVFHLDRYTPGWYWPKRTNTMQHDSAVSIGRNLKKRGQIPPSWLLSHLTGECNGPMLPSNTVLMLWDRILTCENNATRFFLTLAVLEQFASSLLLLTGDQLVEALEKVWTLEDVDQHKEPEDKEWFQEWWPRARSLQKSTPESVLDRLKRVEDVAVQQALQRRQERKEAALQARLEAEAAAHREAQEKKAEEARLRLSRARLVAYYRKHAPDKESNIDKIMEMYEGRLDVLDAKLKLKYGESFNPALKPKPPPPPNKLLASVKSRSFGLRRTTDDDDDEIHIRQSDKVSVLVTAGEVLPVVCWSKEAASHGTENHRRTAPEERKHLKFYLVDSRSEEAAHEQGRFPTAVSLSPEAMMDPERLQQSEEMFESLRGAVHIVVMGEGFNALPTLYNQKLTPKLEEMMEKDESRTNLCALWFVKKGFPFVSVLEGGFAAAHSWLVREGPQHHLNASAVLVDYNREASLFGQLETIHNASATEKAQRKMASILEASLVTMTRRAQQIEKLASEMDTKEGIALPFSFLRRSESNTTGSADGSKSGSESGSETTKPVFKIPFTGSGKRDESGNATTETDSANATQNNTPETFADTALQVPSTTNTESSGETEEPPATAEAHLPPSSSSSSSSATSSSAPLGNRFKGFGAAWNQTLKQAQAVQTKRNPFASLRQSAMSRMRAAGPAESEEFPSEQAPADGK